MFKTLRDAFKVKEIQYGITLTFFVLIVIRFGSLIPVPGLNTVAIKEYLESALGDANSFLSSFTGGSFTQMSNFCIECNTIYYFFHYHPASYYCDSSIGGDAEGW